MTLFQHEKNFSKTKTINSFFFYSELSSSYLKPSVLLSSFSYFWQLTDTMRFNFPESCYYLRLKHNSCLIFIINCLFEHFFPFYIQTHKWITFKKLSTTTSGEKAFLLCTSLNVVIKSFSFD